MGYYTDTLDSVAPKGGHVILGTQIEKLYEDRVGLFVQILQNEKNNLSKTKEGKTANDIKKHIDKLKFLIKEEKSDFEDGTDTYLANLVQEELNRFDNQYFLSEYNRTILESKLRDLQAKKSAKGLIRKLILSLRKKEDVSEEELINKIHAQEKLSQMYYNVLRREFCELSYEDKVYYSFVSALNVLDKLYSSPNLDEMNLKDFERINNLGAFGELEKSITPKTCVGLSDAG